MPAAAASRPAPGVRPTTSSTWCSRPSATGETGRRGRRQGGDMVRLHRPRELVTRPTVSVVIPCYNYGRYLADAVASALDQRRLDVEVIIVDDASTDGSAAVARAIAAVDPRVEVLVHEQNAGHIRTYNDGLARATGDYLVLLSADDRLPRDAVTRAVALMERHPRVGLVYGHPDTFQHEPVPSSPRTWSW